MGTTCWAAVMRRLPIDAIRAGLRHRGPSPLAAFALLAVPIHQGPVMVPGAPAGDVAVIVRVGSLDSWLTQRDPSAPEDAAPQPPPPAPAGKAKGDIILPPFLSVAPVPGQAGQPTPLVIEVLPSPVRPGATQEPLTYVVISRVPAAVSLSRGLDLGSGNWEVPLESLRGLTLTVPPGIGGTLDLKVTAVTDHGRGLVATQTSDVSIPMAAAEPASPAPAASPAAVAQQAPAAEPTPVAEPAPAPVLLASPVVLPTLPAPPDPIPVPVVHSVQDSPPPTVTVTVAAVAPEPVPAPTPVPEAVPAREEPKVAALPPQPAPAVASKPAESAGTGAKPRAASSVPDKVLIKRGDDLFAQGDLAGARLYYEMAAASGSAAAALAAGGTYDPRVHERLHVRGLPANPDQALSWYRRAQEGGLAEAETRLSDLKSWLGSRGIAAKTN